MIDPELKQHLNTINQSVVRLDKGRWWKSLLDGILRGFGSILGVILAVLFLGWMLNVAGVIPAFKQEVEQWRKLLQDTQRQVPTTQRSVDQSNQAR